MTDSTHPAVIDVNRTHAERLSPVERFCKRVADATGAPAALIAAIVIQTVWIVIGVETRWDPFPFVFLLTVSNVIQLILIFVIAVAQKQSSQHDALRAESDHANITHLLYHQRLQEAMLLSLASRAGIETSQWDALTAQLEREESC